MQNVDLLLNKREAVLGNIGQRLLQYGPNAARSVHTTEVKILPYRPTKLG